MEPDPPQKEIGAENRALVAAVGAYAHTARSDDVSAITAFLEKHPHSPWRPSLLGNLGLIWRRTGYIQRSIDAFEEAWRLTRRRKDRNARVIANWAFGKMARTHSHFGHAERIRQLSAELGDRLLFGPATEQWTMAVEGLRRSREHPEEEARCGPLSIAQISRRPRARKCPPRFSRPKRRRRECIWNRWARSPGRQDCSFTLSSAEPGTPLPLPAVIHWNANRYTAVVQRRVENGVESYLVENPLYEEAIWVTLDALDEETSGYMLVPEDQFPEGWTIATRRETRRVYGGCWRGEFDIGQYSLYAVMAKCRHRSEGMAVYNFDAMLISLHIEDQPAGYTRPIGPAARFLTVYNQRDAFQPAVFSYSNLGPKWTFSFLSYVIDGGPRTPGGFINVYLRGGGLEYHRFTRVFPLPQSGEIHYQSQAELVALGDGEMHGLRKKAAGWFQRDLRSTGA